jgi:glucokinase
VFSVYSVGKKSDIPISQLSPYPIRSPKTQKLTPMITHKNNSIIYGVDIGGTKTAVCRWSESDGLEELARFATSDPTSTLDQVAAIVAALPPAEAIGIACGGPLDAPSGTILSPPNLPGWDAIPVTKILSTKLGAPSFLMNDANANALAEWRFGFNRDCASLIYLTAGTGMGAGIILNGQLIEGATGSAGEVGHLRLAPDGPNGFGKRGSFEGFCSGGGLPHLIEFLPAEERPTNWLDWQRQHPTAKSINEAAQAGEPVAISLLTAFGRRLGQALALLIDCLNPHRIIIGSLYLRCQPFVEPAMREVLVAECLAPSLAACQITPSPLGESVGNYGAISAALHGRGAFR